ncbi:MAG: hypothetical protein AcusKO_33760 [Acuticoccus sp.]
MCVKSQRSVSVSLTLRYNRVLFVLEPNDISANLARKRVTVCDYPDGRLEIQHGGICLPYRAFGLKRLQRAEVVENKRLDEVLAIAERMIPVKRSNNSPRRRGQTNSMFHAPTSS